MISFTNFENMVLLEPYGFNSKLSYLYSSVQCVPINTLVTSYLSGLLSVVSYVHMLSWAVSQTYHCSLSDIFYDILKIFIYN